MFLSLVGSYLPKPGPVLKEIMEASSKELKLREQCSFAKPRDQQLPPGGLLQFSSKGFNLSSTLLSNSPQAVWCSYCKQGHPSVKCNIITRVDPRKQLLRKKGRCFLCLRGGHLARNCKGESRCVKCHGLHHTLICDKDVQINKNGDQVKPSVTSRKGGETSTNLCMNDSKRSVLLQTVKAVIVRPEDGAKPATVRMVFYSCSQRSYVSDDIKERMELAVVGREILLIKTFGESDAKLRKCDVVQV